MPRKGADPNQDPGTNGLGRQKLPDTSWRDVDTPETKDALEKVISKAVARVLELACQPKDLTEAIKAATAWHEQLYGKEPEEGYGVALTGAQGGNGHGG